MILIFYKYVTITDPTSIKQWLLAVCTERALKGRIILAHEGINATIGGTDLACKQFMEIIATHPLFHDIDIKTSEGMADHFPRLRITIRPEIVALGISPDAVPAHNAAPHLTPAEFHALLAQHDPEVVVLDTRNAYESAIGTFEGAITADIEYFRDFPAYIEKNKERFANKKLIMACTAGVRCERASAYVKQTGIAKEIYQLHGGIHRYVEQFPRGYFKGKNYVFDGRIALSVTDDIIGHCSHCQTPCDEYLNCINTRCNKKFISCVSCANVYNQTCSTTCKTLVVNGSVKVRTKPARIMVESLI